MGTEVNLLPLPVLTTPDPVVLQASFADMVKQGFGACAIEASSIGIAEERMAGTRIAVALFTNFTRDHLDSGSVASPFRETEKMKDGSEVDMRRAYAMPPDEAIAATAPIDPQVGILKLDRIDGTPLAVLIRRNAAVRRFRGFGNKNRAAIP